MEDAVAAIAEELAKHGYDSTSQDSGMRCHCGSDSRFYQVRLHERRAALKGRGDVDDPSWKTIDEHRAQRVLAVLQRLMREAMEASA